MVPNGVLWVAGSITKRKFVEVVEAFTILCKGTMGGHW